VSWCNQTVDLEVIPLFAFGNAGLPVFLCRAFSLFASGMSNCRYSTAPVNETAGHSCRVEGTLEALRPASSGILTCSCDALDARQGSACLTPKYMWQAADTTQVVPEDPKNSQRTMHFPMRLPF
jgi:hypothetical protein